MEHEGFIYTPRRTLHGADNPYTDYGAERTAGRYGEIRGGARRMTWQNFLCRFNDVAYFNFKLAKKCLTDINNVLLNHRAFQS